MIDDVTSDPRSSMSLDLGDTWHQGLPTSPQWEGLELDCDETEHEDDGSHEEFDSAAEKGAKDYISEVRESSLSLRDCVTPASVLVLREVVRCICRFVVLSRDKMFRRWATPCSSARMAQCCPLIIVRISASLM